MGRTLSIPLLAILVIVLSMVVSLNPASSSKTIVSQKQGYAQDFSWVVGKLEWNELEGGFWQVRFGDASVTYGGKFVLGNDPKLEEFQEGDLVKITGQITPQQVSIYMSGTIYLISSIERIGP